MEVNKKKKKAAKIDTRAIVVFDKKYVIRFIK